jgi:protein-S-isoprenylcysteine O-methyltransferase Ste14
MSPTTTPIIERSVIIRRGIQTVGLLTVSMSLVLFLSAGTVAWSEAWIFLGLFLVYFIIWVSWGLKHSPDLIMERGQALRKGGKPWDMRIVRINLLLSLITYLVAGLDAMRFQWSTVAFPAQALGLALLLAGYVLPFLALSNNPFASGVVRIETERGHQVARGGPYRIVRHPMYVGTILADIGTPVFLGSLWALIPGFLMAALFIYRTAREDATLLEELPGYQEYAQSVRYRLIPGLW